jgi:mannose/fructose/N-acetylgalactosamine-specific phosphotransferase system component IID
MEGAMITGLMSTGALVTTWLSFTTPLTYVKEGAAISLQNMFNGIFPKILPGNVKPQGRVLVILTK